MGAHVPHGDYTVLPATWQKRWHSRTYPSQLTLISHLVTSKGCKAELIWFAWFRRTCCVPHSFFRHKIIPEMSITNFSLNVLSMRGIDCQKTVLTSALWLILKTVF